jgi:hypothetical protein
MNHRLIRSRPQAKALARRLTNGLPPMAPAMAMPLLVLWLAAANVTAARADQRPLGPDAAARAEIIRQSDQEWRFRVYLDDKAIGYHDFYLDDRGETRVLRSYAEFEYRLMFVKLYDYVHSNNEVWQGDCLARIESSTDANGKPFAVSGVAQDEGFVVQGNHGVAKLPGCVMSFAYWNPEFLKASRLLNTQNGDYLDVVVSDPVREDLEVQGQLRPSYRYNLVAGPLNIDLWYSENQQWLGLSTQASGGRTLRYELL